MAEASKVAVNFTGGYLPDGGPFFGKDGYIKDGLNTTIQLTGEVENRLGIEILDSTATRLFEDVTNVVNNNQSSLFFAEVVKNDGSLVELIFMNWGKNVFVYANDGVIYTNSIENIGANIDAADFVFDLTNFSNLAWDYKSRWAQEGNTIIMVSPFGPITKFVWGDVTTGSETLSAFRIELSEYNDNLFKVTRASTLGKSVPGWFASDLPAKTGKTVYTVLDFASDAVPGYITTAFKIDSDGHHTLQTLTTDYTYAETLDSTINIVTATITLVTALNTGEVLRVYFGPDTLPNFDASLNREEIIVAGKTKDFSSDDSAAPGKVVQFGGRSWFFNVNGPLDATDDATYNTLGTQPKKIWVSDIFNSSLLKEENTHLKCRQAKSPFDKDDNIRLPTEGNVILLDNAARLLDGAAFANSLYIVASNGVWAITGQDEFFALNQTRIRKIIDHKFISAECISTIDNGLVIWGESEVFLITPTVGDNREPINRIAKGAVYSFYNKIDIELKRRGMARYDSFSKRAYYIYPSTIALAGSKFGSSSVGNKAMVFDTQIGAWQTPVEYGGTKLLISDMVTIPSKSFFASSDFRNADFRKVNLVLLINNTSLGSEARFGILEGKPFCADYVGTTDKEAFRSFVETTNIFGSGSDEPTGAGLGLGRKKQVARLYINLKRQERGDADSNGFYEFPGACYMQRRWRHADNENAGPLYDFVLDATQDNWVEQRQQVYFPFRYGATVIGGKKPGFEVVPFETKLRGRGEVVRLSFGNFFGDTSLTDTVEEQEKGWGLFGYELVLSANR